MLRKIDYVMVRVPDLGPAVATARQAGCTVREEPFDVTIGMCAVLADPFGNTVSLLDMTKGPR